MSYFKTWRRKIGVITLLIACVFAAGWVKSLSVYDHFDVGHHYLISSEGRLTQQYRYVTYVREWPSVSFQIVWTIRYRSIVIPSTLISLWLLLSNPNHSTSEKIAEPFPEEGT